MVQEMIFRLRSAIPPLLERTSAELLHLETFKYTKYNRFH